MPLSPRLFRLIPLLVVAVALLIVPGACYRVEYRATTQVPPALVGAWDGEWFSSRGIGQGRMAMRLQTFEDRPVLQIDTSHPCLQGGNFQLVLRGSHFEVRRNGVAVFTAELDSAARRLSGSYECAADRGDWTVEWESTLPPFGDVSGDWTGTFATVQPQVELDFALHLHQAWLDGSIGVTGEVLIEGQAEPVPISSGLVFHSGEGFDLLLRGDVGGASLRIQGAGHFGDPVSASGLAFVDSASGSVLAGAWTAERLPP